MRMGLERRDGTMTNTLKIAPKQEIMAERVETTFRPSPCVLVYYDGEMTSVAALRAACAECKPGMRIVAVYLDMLPMIPESKGKGQDRVFMAKAVLAAAVVNAATYGFEIETLSLETYRRGMALVKLAADCGDSAIYIGVDEEHPDWLADYLAENAANVVRVEV